MNPKRYACVLGAALLMAFACVAASAQNTPPTDSPASAKASRLRIEVTGGDANAPVENASVYLKYVEERKLRKDKKIELNVKTNREGVAHVPDAPLGKVLIQVIAEGWKTYGKWFDVTEAREPIKIKLEKPPRWY